MTRTVGYSMWWPHCDLKLDDIEWCLLPLYVATVNRMHIIIMHTKGAGHFYMLIYGNIYSPMLADSVIGATRRV